MLKLQRNESILAAAHEAWLSLADFRRRRARYKRFTYGDQWSDLVPAPDGSMVTAARRALADGRRPMTNNLLRRLVKSVIGRFRYQRDELPAVDGAAGKIYRANNLDELDCRSLEEFLISGCVVQRVGRGRSFRGDGVWVDPVSPDDFFATPIRDPRSVDTELVGMIHDWSLAETILRLAGDDADRAEAIRAHYLASPADATPMFPSLMASDAFLRPASSGRCRVVEVWMLQIEEPGRSAACRRRQPRRGESRPMPCVKWRCYWLSPDGTILRDDDAPGASADAPGGRHPFHFRFYPLVDGEIHSLVADVVDQQIYINELISLIDHVVSCSAKGVLIFPSDLKLASMSWQDVCSAWSSPGGVIPVKSADGRLPQQFHTSGTNLGATDLLTTQMQMFEDVSGVANALMGRSSSGNIGAEHYESQVKNAIIAITDLLSTFGNFIDVRNDSLSDF